MTDGPGKDRVAGYHQVVDGQGDQGAVVGGHTRRAQDLEHGNMNVQIFVRPSRELKTD